MEVDRSANRESLSPISAKKEWLSEKRAEYSNRLLATGRIDQVELANTWIVVDVFTSSAVQLSWESRQVVQEFLHAIKKIYVCYATFGEVELTKDMNSSNFYRLIIDCLKVSSPVDTAPSSLVRQHHKAYFDYVQSSRRRPVVAANAPQINQRDLELIFFEYCRVQPRDRKERNTDVTSSMFPVDQDNMTERIAEARISFEDFLNILQRLSAQAFPDRSDHEGLREFLKKLFLPLLDSDIVQTGFHDISCVGKLKRILQNPNQLKMLGTLYKNVQVYFTFYTSCRGKMDFKGFQSFFKDFGIYPSLVSMQTLQSYFSALASLEVDSR